jgi:hypothetical protein
MNTPRQLILLIASVLGLALMASACSGVLYDRKFQSPNITKGQYTSIQFATNGVVADRFLVAMKSRFKNLEFTAGEADLTLTVGWQETKVPVMFGLMQENSIDRLGVEITDNKTNELVFVQVRYFKAKIFEEITEELLADIQAALMK